MNACNWSPKLATCFFFLNILWKTKQQGLSYTAGSPSVRNKLMFYSECQETKTSCMYPEGNQWLIDYICVPEQAPKRM